MSDFETEIQNLYKTFERYPKNSNIVGCPCCVSSKEKSKLLSTTLQNLESEDLSYYAFKAMTIFGDIMFQPPKASDMITINFL